MMPHSRQTIRRAIVDHLTETDTAGVYHTSAAARVFANRAKPLFQKDLPAILVYTRTERIDPRSREGDGFGPRRRELQLAVEIVAEAGEGLDDALDGLAAEVETLLNDWEMPGREATSIELAETEMDLTGDGDRLLGAARLTYEVTYWDGRPEPANDGAIPTDVRLGVAPNIGLGHENDYQKTS